MYGENQGSRDQNSLENHDQQKDMERIKKSVIRRLLDWFIGKISMYFVKYFERYCSLLTFIFSRTSFSVLCLSYEDFDGKVVSHSSLLVL
jgi:hypothetical protein